MLLCSKKECIIRVLLFLESPTKLMESESINAY